MKILRWAFVLAIVALAIKISLMPEPEETVSINTSLAENFATLSKIYLKKNDQVVDEFVQKHLDVDIIKPLSDTVMYELESSAQQLARNFQNYVIKSDSLLKIMDVDEIWLKTKKIQNRILRIDQILLEVEINKIIILKELIEQKQKRSTNKKSHLETRYIVASFLFSKSFLL